MLKVVDETQNSKEDFTQVFFREIMYHHEIKTTNKAENMSDSSENTFHNLKLSAFLIRIPSSIFLKNFAVVYIIQIK